MSQTYLLFVPLVLAFSASEQIRADWNPSVYNAIKWTAENQGKDTIAYTTHEGITRIPMVYHGGVDTNSSGEITNRDKANFATWVQENLPLDYCGPVVMDYEQPWWKELSSKSLSPELLQEILSVYREGVDVATQILPNAQWGYWGLPLLRHTGRVWEEQGLSLLPLTTHCIALYPDIYDDSRGTEHTERTKKHITKVLELAHGDIPVYVFVSPRFTREGGDRTWFVPDDVFLRRVNAAMQAVWIDENGAKHKIQGVILWDTYSFTQESEWDELDQKHKYYFELLQALIQAWRKSMVGIQISDIHSSSPFCQYGLPEPRNSGDTISSTQPNTENREIPKIENDRVPSGRIQSKQTF